MLVHYTWSAAPQLSQHPPRLLQVEVCLPYSSMAQCLLPPMGKAIGVSRRACGVAFVALSRTGWNAVGNRGMGSLSRLKHVLLCCPVGPNAV